MKIRASTYGVTLALALLVAVIDQAIKGLVTGAFAPDKSLVLIPGVLALRYQQNTGVAFGMFHDASMALLLLINLLVLAVFVLLARPFLRTRAGIAAAVLVAGGALGNLIDRFRWNYVVDYLDISVWPVFNIADTCVVIGVALLVMLMFRSERAGHTPESNPQ